MSVAPDTNVFARLLVNDEPAQAAMARDVLAQPFSASVTVLLETEWLLRSLYKWPRAAIAGGLTEILDLPTLTHAPTGIRWAIARYEAGADFADMVHLITARPAERFVTFDRKIVRHAGADTPIPIETLA